MDEREKKKKEKRYLVQGVGGTDAVRGLNGGWVILEGIVIIVIDRAYPCLL